MHGKNPEAAAADAEVAEVAAAEADTASNSTGPAMMMPLSTNRFAPIAIKAAPMTSKRRSFPVEFHHLQYGADRGNFHRSQAVPRG